MSEVVVEEVKVLGVGTVGDRVVKFMVLKNWVEVAVVEVIGVEEASVLGAGVVGDRVSGARFVGTCVEVAGVA